MRSRVAVISTRQWSFRHSKAHYPKYLRFSETLCQLKGRRRVEQPFLHHLSATKCFESSASETRNGRTRWGTNTSDRPTNRIPKHNHRFSFSQSKGQLNQTQRYNWMEFAYETPREYFNNGWIIVRICPVSIICVQNTIWIDCCCDMDGKDGRSRSGANALYKTQLKRTIPFASHSSWSHIAGHRHHHHQDLPQSQAQPLPSSESEDHCNCS